MEFVEAVNGLKKQVDVFGGAEAHMTAENIHNEEGTTAVLSVYKGVKPSHMVLEELYEWAEEKGDQTLVDKIEELGNDMSWNEND